MATKNLARTIIEGGRTSRSRYERRNSYKEENAALRGYLQRVALDPEYAEGALPKKRVKAFRSFDDRLGPAKAWIQSHVGQPWDDVYSELRRTFDTRTVPGQHIVYDHILSEVAVVPEVREFWRSRDRFWVDEEGVLREHKRERRARYDRPEHFLFGKARDNYAQIVEWLHYRKVGRRGEVWFWFEPTALGWGTCPLASTYGPRPVRCPEAWREHRQVPYAGFRPGYVGPTTYPQHRVGGAYHRQTTRLTREEVRRWVRFFEGWFGAGSEWNERREALEMRLD